MSEFLDALAKTPQRIVDAFTDPTRRLHIGIQVGRALAMGVGGYLLGTLVSPLAVPAVVAADYLGYEFGLEPLSKGRVKRGKRSLVGPYWETGPQDGETFTRP